MVYICQRENSQQRELIRKRKRHRMLKKWWKRKYFHLKEKYDPVGPCPWQRR